MSSVYVGAMHGLGDNINHRAFVRAACDTHDTVYLATPWPQLYTDLRTRTDERVRLVRKATVLRTQARNQAAWPGPWDRPPMLPMHQMGYDWTRPSIIQCMEARAPWSTGVQLSWDMPPPARPPGLPARYAVVRPVTVRKEWNGQARNPSPVYVQEAINILRQRGFYVITVADIEPGQEDFVGPAPTGQHEMRHAGIGGLDRLLELVAHADICVGGVGFLLPMAIAYRRPVFMIGGGLGAHNAREIVTDPRMDLSRLGWATPNQYCRSCGDQRHDCPKHISGFDVKFDRWVRQIERHGQTESPRG